MYSIIHKCFILVHIHCQRWAPKTAVMLSFFRPYMYYPQVCCTCLYSMPVVGTKNGSPVSTSVLNLFIFNSSGGHQNGRSFILAYIQFQWWAPKTAVLLNFIGLIICIIHKCFILAYIQFQWWAPKTAVNFF